MNYDLQRFLDAQALMYQQALKEVEAGKKEDHWIWFIFPQLKGLGKSNSSRYFGISGIDEARAYYEHPVLGTRLREVTGALLMNDKSADEIFGKLDAQKVRSCMTLFNYIAKYVLKNEDDIFQKALNKFYDGKGDALTGKMLEE